MSSVPPPRRRRPDLALSREISSTFEKQRQESLNRRLGIVKKQIEFLEQVNKRQQDTSSLAKQISRSISRIKHHYGLTTDVVLERLGKIPREVRELVSARRIRVLGDPADAPEDLDTLIAEHRRPQTSRPYGDVALNKTYIKRMVNVGIQRFIQTYKRQPTVVEKAQIQESVTKAVYDLYLDSNVRAGHYLPQVIGYEMVRELNQSTTIPSDLTLDKAQSTIRKELVAMREAGKLNQRQVDHIFKNVVKTMELYQEAYPEQSIENAFILGRDLARIAAYQELHDKAVFTGSDHGSKHIHHNIENATDIMAEMLDEDLTAKDRFLVRMVHFYHDIGYSVGAAERDFDCMKDHPLIGGRFLQEHKEYFTALIGQEEFETLFRCVLQHAIPWMDITPDQPVAGHHPNLVRALTSISDACAATYDRKTQEFWEQPEAVRQLSRLKLFLCIYPEYKRPFFNPPKFIAQVEAQMAEGSASEKDIRARDLFLDVRANLLQLIEEAPIPEDKKAAFSAAVTEQLNTFTPKITLGQYGAVLHGLGAFNQWEATGEQHGPKYLPVVKVAPSLIYGAIGEIFGYDQASAAFTKICEDLAVDPHEVVEAAQEMGHHLVLHDPNLQTREIVGKNGIFRVVNEFDTTMRASTWDISGTRKIDLHGIAETLLTLQEHSLRSWLQRIPKLVGSAAKKEITKAELNKAFDAFIADARSHTFVRGTSSLAIVIGAVVELKRLLPERTKIEARFQKILNSITDSRIMRDPRFEAAVARFRKDLTELHEAGELTSESLSQSRARFISTFSEIPAKASEQGIILAQLENIVSEVEQFLIDTADHFEKYKKILHGLRTATLTEAEQTFMTGEAAAPDTMSSSDESSESDSI